MSPISSIPALAGFLCGLSFFPMLSLLANGREQKKVLKREQQRLKNTTFILSGKLSEPHLISHIRSLCSLGRQGALHVIDGRRKGYLLFRDKEIVDGFYRNRSGESGFSEIMKIAEGDYYFESRQVLQPNLIKKSIEQLLQEENHNEQPIGEGKHHER